MSATSTVSVLTPASEDEAAALVTDAAAAKRTLGIVGGGTRAGFGRPTEPAVTLSSAKLSGIHFYEPAELVIGVGAGTPLRDVEAALAENGQMLAFEPMDHRALYGSTGEPTIGGVTAVNASGPRRIRVGAARDALLGVRFVNGSGEIIKSGGRVMKNVTGLDLVKLLCGSHGTLGFLTEVTFKVLPQPEHMRDAGAGGAWTTSRRSTHCRRLLGSPFEPTGAAHLPAALGGSGTHAGPPGGLRQLGRVSRCSAPPDAVALGRGRHDRGRRGGASVDRYSRRRAAGRSGRPRDLARLDRAGQRGQPLSRPWRASLPERSLVL